MLNGLIFDLDDTLIVGRQAAISALRSVTTFAAARSAIDSAQLERAVPARAHDLWLAGPRHDYCKRIGLSAWEGLWCQFEGPSARDHRLKEWAPEFRRKVWAQAISEQGVDDLAFAELLADLYMSERRARHETFPDAHAILTELRQHFPLGLVTNGASCLQREKLAATGLAAHFSVVVVSDDIGIGKPAAEIYFYALAKLEVDVTGTVMVGDSLCRDVAGAKAIGMGAIWVNPDGDDSRRGITVPEITGLGQLPTALAEIQRAR